MVLFAANIYWHLPILLLTVSFVYTATRHNRWDLIWKEALGWILRMTGFLGGLGALLYVLSSHPKLWPYAVALLIIGGVIYYSFSVVYLRKKPTK